MIKILQQINVFKMKILELKFILIKTDFDFVILFSMILFICLLTRLYILLINLDPDNIETALRA